LKIVYVKTFGLILKSESLSQETIPEAFHLVQNLKTMIKISLRISF